MEEKQAREIGERLARALNASREDEWSIWASLMTFPSAATNLWVSREQAVAHWLDGQTLVTATALEQARVRIVARPAATGLWRIEVACQSAQLDDAGFAHPGLKSHWKLSFPSGEHFEVVGEVLVTRDSSTPDDAQKLAGSMAARMIAEA